MTAVVGRAFADAFGARRGAAPSQRTILDARAAVAEDELTRLMGEAVARRFAEPLRVVRACAAALHLQLPGQPFAGAPVSKADVLCMCVATQLAATVPGEDLTALGAVFYPDDPAVWGSGIRSRIAHLLESRLVAIPPDGARAWLDAHYPQLLEEAVVMRVGQDPRSSLTALGCEGEIDEAALQRCGMRTLAQRAVELTLGRAANAEQCRRWLRELLRTSA